MSQNNHSPLLPSGGYRKLRSYKVAEVVYDATVVFCRRFFANDRRMTDQMVQAARSGVRNISEGSGASATSRKTEMKLTNVARSSLTDELLPDYESFLTQRGLRVWLKDSREAKAMRERLKQDMTRASRTNGKVRLTGLLGLSDFVEKAAPEFAANAMICAVNQAAYLLRRQLESQGRAFLKEGGFTENLHASRTSARNPNLEPSPTCPKCNRPMLRRIAKTGPLIDRPFWGCSSYPNCKGTRPVETPTQTRQTSPTSPTRPTHLTP